MGVSPGEIEAERRALIAMRLPSQTCEHEFQGKVSGCEKREREKKEEDSTGKHRAGEHYHKPPHSSDIQLVEKSKGVPVRFHIQIRKLKEDQSAVDDFCSNSF